MRSRIFEGVPAPSVVFIAAYALALVTDLREGRIPNWLTYPLLLIALFARPNDVGLAPIANIVAALVSFALFAAFALRGWMGMGDAKLAAAIALASGPALGAIALWLAFAAGALIGVALVVTRRIDRERPLPFGPFLALGGTAAALVPDALLRYSPFGPLFG
jgi:prepilin signal peptidase PulO-like enzyme (type II secretory pathway)